MVLLTWELPYISISIIEKSIRYTENYFYNRHVEALCSGHVEGTKTFYVCTHTRQSFKRDHVAVYILII